MFFTIFSLLGFRTPNIDLIGPWC